MRVAETAIAAAGENDPLPALSEIGEQRLAVLLVDLRPHRHFEHGVGAVRAVPIFAHAAAAILGEKMLLEAIVNERVEAFDCLGNHIAALATVSTIGAAEFNELLPPKRHAAVAAVAGADVDLSLVEELHT